MSTTIKDIMTAQVITLTPEDRTIAWEPAGEGWSWFMVHYPPTDVTDAQ